MGNNISISNNNIKIITYNPRISFFSKYKCNKLINYLSNFKKNKCIICLQGITDINSRKYILNETKNYFNQDLLMNSDLVTGNLLILTNFDMKNILYKNLNIKNKLIDSDSGVLISDIIIDNKILSIYNTELQEDISNISLNSLRIEQLENILKIISVRINSKDNNHNGLHIIIGSLFIDEINNKNLIDIIEFYNNEIKKNSKNDYILFYSKKNNFDIKNIKKIINNKYNIEILDIYNRHEVNYSDSLPLELVIKLNLKNNLLYK